MTSSRADFGIYLPLLKALKQDTAFSFELIVFGTHLSGVHGFTKKIIIESGFTVRYEIASLLVTDDPASISTSYALTALKFADFWNEHKSEFDLVICLGDRFEMAAAVFAGVPMGVRFAHIHGGETTLGAIDNVYRHSISVASIMHFCAAEPFKKRIKEICGTDANAIVVGALSLDNLTEINLLASADFLRKWGIDIEKPYVLVTVHPETVSFDMNARHWSELEIALAAIVTAENVVVTMPNADTNGSLFREGFQKFQRSNPGKVYLIENFGTESYFTCMKHSKLLIGNTSSGIIEAASFGKYVLDLGDRQKGRLASENVIPVPFESRLIVDGWNKYSGKEFRGKNIYFRGNASALIIEHIKKHFNATI